MIDINDQKETTISLVLGSGGARGMAHIGVIQVLEERGYSIHSISDSSVGALVGGIYAAGQLESYTKWACALERLDVLRLLDFSFSGTALFKGDRIINTQIPKDMCTIYEFERAKELIGIGRSEAEKVLDRVGSAP